MNRSPCLFHGQSCSGHTGHSGSHRIRVVAAMLAFSKRPELVSGFVETLTYHQDIPGDKGGN